MLDETDVVCGADIFFLPALFADLTTLLRLCVDYKPEIKIILAATMRNEDTWNQFLDECKNKKLKVVTLSNCLDLDEYFVYERSSILIVSVSAESS
ncbi:Oidioi.mRNA.OKI2018_I69.XSR.g14412.t1.cds [Oikopleura dioica]|uniref:Oidioi.mRNA.OKI2018_I69.XSR.g14412.t1.cds n=1 Tax=Oikopleura dioica TaxID=34765 RepID=A0ABN7SBH5_OIKDI|nr:Oidioi.mRNA.OKI2018_I69.XSR.g14412.t1.cds [Oikopleura dioica]